MEGKIKRRVLFKNKKYSSTVSLIVFRWETRTGVRYQCAIKDRYRGYHLGNTKVLNDLAQCIFEGLEMAQSADQLAVRAKALRLSKKSKVYGDDHFH